MKTASTWPALLMAGQQATLTVNLVNTAGITSPKLNAWIDWNGDGDFAGERGRADRHQHWRLVSGNNSLTINIPAGASTLTPIGARFRLSLVAAWW